MSNDKIALSELISMYGAGAVKQALRSAFRAEGLTLHNDRLDNIIRFDARISREAEGYLLQMAATRRRINAHFARMGYPDE